MTDRAIRRHNARMLDWFQWLTADDRKGLMDKHKVHPFGGICGLRRCGVCGKTKIRPMAKVKRGA